MWARRASWVSGFSFGKVRSFNPMFGWRIERLAPLQSGFSRLWNGRRKLQFALRSVGPGAVGGADGDFGEYFDGGCVVAGCA